MEAANLLPSLEKEDLRVLMAIEIGMKRSEYVKISNIRFYSRLTIEEAIKTVMSVGIVTPHHLPIALSGKKVQKESIENLKEMNYPNPKLEGGS